MLGIPPTGQTVELTADMLVNDDLTLVASFGYTSRAWGRVVELLNAGRISPGSIVTHRFPLEDHGLAFAQLARADRAAREDPARDRRRGASRSPMMTSRAAQPDHPLLDRLERLYPAVVSDCLDHVGSAIA